MKIYHTETQKDYDALMVELEAQGCEWLSGNKPTSWNYWSLFGEETCVRLDDDTITQSFKSFYDGRTPIIKYESKADEKLVNSTQGKSVVREGVSYQIDPKAIRVNSVVQYQEIGGDWVRGLVKFVDRDRIKVVRSYGTNYSFSATDIGMGNIKIKVEIY